VSATDRHARGLELLEAVQGSDAAGVHAGLQELSPDLAAYVLEAGFADVYGRPGLDLEQRQLLNIAALTTLGGCERQLAVHVRGALNVGVSALEIVEAIIHVALYAGHPRAINGLRVANEVFDQQGVARPHADGRKSP
jgi:4-carboxymuconolactone decarboxylase